MRNIFGWILLAIGLLVFCLVGVGQVFSGDVFNGIVNLVIGIILFIIGWNFLKD